MRALARDVASSAITLLPAPDRELPRSHRRCRRQSLPPRATPPLPPAPLPVPTPPPPALPPQVPLQALLRHLLPLRRRRARCRPLNRERLRRRQIPRLRWLLAFLLRATRLLQSLRRLPALHRRTQAQLLPLRSLAPPRSHARSHG